MSSYHQPTFSCTAQNDTPKQTCQTFLLVVLSRILYSCAVVTVEVTPQFEYEGTSGHPQGRLQKFLKLQVFFGALPLLQGAVVLHSSNGAGSVVMTWELWRFWLLCWHWYHPGHETAYMLLHNMHIFAGKDMCWYMQPVSANIRSNLVGAINNVRRRNSKSASSKASESVNPDNCC